MTLAELLDRMESDLPDNWQISVDFTVEDASISPCSTPTVCNAATRS